VSIACDVARALAARLLRLVGPLGSHSGGFGPNERAGIMALIKAAASARK